KNNAEKAEAEAKQKELDDFIHDSSQLLSRIQFWFDEADSNIKVEKSKRNITVENKIISVQSLTLKNGKKELSIGPEYKGVVSVSLGSNSPFENFPDNLPEDLFSLVWKDPNNTACMWAISYKNENKEQINKPFNEESFFLMLEPFA
ncbi:hypothetical protein ACUVF2_004866, partial [Escherichia coli]